MRMKKKLALVLVAALCGLGYAAQSAHADTITTYTFSFFSVNSSVQGSGVLISDSALQPVGEPANEQLITGGYIDSLTTSGAGYSTPPQLNLFTESTGGATYSPSGYFIFDDQLFPSNSLLVDNPGLLFTATNGPVNEEVNIYASYYNSDGTPVLYYENSGFNTPIALTLSDGVVTNAVPLPASAGVGFSMLGGLSVLAVLRRKLGSKSRIA